jgi:hypothetical protein
MSPFIQWKKKLQEEDILEFGSVIDRPDSAYDLLYKMYKKSLKCSEDKKG